MPTFRGEKIDTTLNPTSVAIVGATSGSFTVSTASSTSGNSGTVGVVAVDGAPSSGDGARVIKHNHANLASGLDSYPTIVGDATVTITAAAGSQVHYTLNGRNPTSKASGTSTADSTDENKRMNRSRDGHARIYSSAFTIENSRPGSDLVTLRIRAYKTANQEINGETVSGISPNEKSQVLIIRFVLKNASFTLPNDR